MVRLRTGRLMLVLAAMSACTVACGDDAPSGGDDDGTGEGSSIGGDGDGDGDGDGNGNGNDFAFSVRDGGEDQVWVGSLAGEARKIS